VRMKEEADARMKRRKMNDLMWGVRLRERGWVRVKGVRVGEFGFGVSLSEVWVMKTRG
jgi:hypothetical protein